MLCRRIIVRGNVVPAGSARAQWRRWPVALLLSALAAAAGHAQADTVRSDGGDRQPPQEASPTSPRVALEQFLTLTRAGRYADAASYLEPPDSSAVLDPALARQLKAVLDRHLWIDLELMSGLSQGDTTDGLPIGIDNIGTVRAGDGLPVPVRMSRNEGDADVPWRFTSGTVARIPAMYATLDDRWIQDHLPALLLRPGPLDLLWWQWIAVVVLLAVSVAIGAFASRMLRRALVRLVAGTRTEWDDAVVSRIGGPLTAALTLAVVAALLPWLSLYRPSAEASYRIVRVGFFVVFFWSIWRLIDVVRQVLSTSRWAYSSSSSRALLPLGARIAKVIVLAIALVAVLSMLGYPVASLLAGLGLGGLALALAAQKTVENLFGAFSIGIDQPIREGDFVRIEEFVGTVEALGLRSTRFRTLDRTLITIPNGKLAEMRLESFTARDRLRLAAIIGLVYETSGSQMREVLAGLERVLRDHPKIWPDAVVVRFREFAASSLDIEVMAWFQTADWGEFQLIRQEILLQFMDVVEQAGTSFAFPTRTVHLGTATLDAFRGESSRDGPRDGAATVDGAATGEGA